MALKKKTTISGASPKPPKSTTGATNRTSGYLNPNAAGNKKATPKTYTTTTKSGRKIITSASSVGGSGANSGGSLKFGGIGQTTKVVTTKPKVKKK